MHHILSLQRIGSIVAITAMFLIVAGCGSGAQHEGVPASADIPLSEANKSAALAPPQGEAYERSGGADMSRVWVTSVPAAPLRSGAPSDPNAQGGMMGKMGGIVRKHKKVDSLRKQESQLQRPLAPVPAEEATGESYESIVDNPFHETAVESAVDLFDRRRHRQLCQRPPLPHPEHAAAQGRGAHRRDAQLLRLSATRRRRSRASIRSRCTSRSPAARGTPSTGWPASASPPSPSTRPQRPPSNLVFLVDVSGSMATSPTSCRWCNGACSGWSSSSARTTRSPSSSTRVHRAWCCRRPRACNKAEITVGHRPVAGRRLDQRRRGHPARLRRRRPELHQERHQPRHPGHRRRFQRRRLQSRTS